ncbi:MAG: dihydropteroate synthase [Deltaproteobacteria bacterium]|nr:dihydropteroate synthase [Deltaproteobacteria bacterium]
MAVVNLTPDSFHDGGKLVAEGSDAPNVTVALRRCQQLVAQGASVLDIGGESTRPGAEPVSPAIELARVLPLLQRLAGDTTLTAVPVSVDTRHAEVAAAAIAAGAAIVNDVSGLADPAMLDVIAASRAGLVVGHLRGEPRDMQRDIRFADVLGEVADELAHTVERAVAAGVARARILVDPGIGFGKTAEQSAALVAASGWLRAATGCGVLIGASRKSFLAALVPDGGASASSDRMVASVTAAVIAVERGAAVLRVHDVKETACALAVARGLADAFERARAGAAGRGGPRA